MRSLLLRPHAKINLGLRILGIREDGYHEIHTRFQSISLRDELEIQSTARSLELRVEGAAVPDDGTNMVLRTAESLRGRRRGLPGARIRLVKGIPVSAGLGGGSSDAAAALMGLDRVWDVGLSPSEMREIASELGADVPFFLEGGTALGEGRGDLIRPLPTLPLQHICLVLPPYGSSTQEAYRRWDLAHPRPAGGNLAADPKLPAKLPGDPAFESLHNDLQEQLLDGHPELREILSLFHRTGASAASVSGSGSSLFGLFRTGEEADAFLRCRHWSPFKVLKCLPVDRDEYRTALGLDPPRHHGSS